jgi:DnaJ-domain-containing protein 1
VDLGFAMTSPVPPGTYEIAYTYLSSYKSGKLTFAHALRFGADTFRVLLLQGLGRVTGIGLEEMEHLVLGERDYQRLEAHDLSAGARITLDFTGLPEPSLWQRWQDIVSGRGFLTRAIPGAFGMALLALLAYVLFRKREPSRATAEGPGQHPALTEAIARLDDRFQERELGKQEYLQRRRDLKGQILSWRDRLSRPTASPTAEGEGPLPAQDTEEFGVDEANLAADPADYYAFLQVDPQARQEVIEAAYRRLARIYHSDVNPSSDANQKMAALNQAYAVLSDPTARANYDAMQNSIEGSGRPEP